MRHAGATAQAIRALPIAMIEAALGALLMPSARGAKTAGAAFQPTRETTVDVTAIAGGTQEEGLPAQEAGPHQEDRHGPAGPEGFQQLRTAFLSGDNTASAWQKRPG